MMIIIRFIVSTSQNTLLICFNQTYLNKTSSGCFMNVLFERRFLEQKKTSLLQSVKVIIPVKASY